MTAELLIKNIELSLRLLLQGSHFHKFNCLRVHTGKILSGFIIGWSFIVQQHYYHLALITNAFIWGRGLIFPTLCNKEGIC